MTSMYMTSNDDRVTDHRPTTDRPRILENFKWQYLCNGSSDPLRIWFYGKNIEENNARLVTI